MIFTRKKQGGSHGKRTMEEDIYDDGEETLKRTSKLNGS